MFRRVLELDPTNAPARLALAAAETEKGNYPRSLELARPALAAFKDSPEGLFILATDYLKTGDRAAAARLAGDWKRLADVPDTGSVAVRRAPGPRRLVAEAIDMLEHAQKAGPPSYELAFDLGGRVPAERRSGARARSLRPGPRPEAGLRSRAAAGGRGGRAAGRARALPLVLAAGQEDRAATIPRSSWASAGSASRWISWTMPSRRSTPGRQPAPGRARLPVHAGRREGREEAVRSGPGADRAPGRGAAGRSAAAVRAGVCAIHPGAPGGGGGAAPREPSAAARQLASPYYLALVARDQGHEAEAISSLRGAAAAAIPTTPRRTRPWAGC